MYPPFQFDLEARKIPPWVKPLLELAATYGIASDGVTFWMLAPRRSLLGQRPVDLVDDEEAILSAAQRGWGIEW